MDANTRASTNSFIRRKFIGGSDARIIMGDDEAALLRLWQEKRGEIEPEDLSGDLMVQLGTVTEELNRHWYEQKHRAGRHATCSGRCFTPSTGGWRQPWTGMVEAMGAVFEAKFMLPWNFSEEAAAEKHMAQLQHNMWVTASRTAVLSIITGGGKWVEMTIPADPLYQHLLADGRKEILALRPERRAPSPVRHRAAAAKDRGRPNRRHERLQRLGRVCQSVSADPACRARP